MSTGHWTERSTADFVYKIASDFVLQLEKKMDGAVSQKELAERLGVSVGRVSQVINNPGNLTIRNIVEYSRALGLKVSVVAYDDGDPENHNGPINSEIFYRCWQKNGEPTDFFALDNPEVITCKSVDIAFPNYIFGFVNASDRVLTGTASASETANAFTSTLSPAGQIAVKNSAEQATQGGLILAANKTVATIRGDLAGRD